jgi:hypothetical protein
MTFNFLEFEKHKHEFANRLTEVCQKELFKGRAPNFNFVIGVKEQGRGWGSKIEVETNDFAKHMNCKMFDTLRLHNFGGGVVSDSDDYWLPIDWRYGHFDGGSNGTRAITIHLNDRGEITGVKQP